MISNDEFDWYRLTQVRGVGTKFLWEFYGFINENSIKLSDLYQNLDSFKIPQKIRAKLEFLVNEQDYSALQANYNRLQEGKVRILHPESSYFPDRLKRNGYKFGIPPILYTRGSVALANSSSIAIVGSRNIEEKALEVTCKLAADLANSSFNIVSGYAKGVDSAAHLGALKAEGTTTMVLSLGLLNFEVKKDFKSVVNKNNTLAISQFSPSEKWLARNAMARNKLVCTLSDALIVIGSGPEIDSRGKMSGTFDAAKSAMAMDIPVFVLSPEYFSEPPIGNLELIKLNCHEISAESGVSQILSKLKDKSLKNHSNHRQKNILQQADTLQLELMPSK